MKSTQIFQCPSDSNSTGVATTAGSPAPGGFVNPFHTSYLANINILRLPNFATVSLAAINQPSSTVMLTDGGSVYNTGSTPANPVTWNNRTNAWILEGYAGTYQAGSADWASPSARHLETVNVAFADGHVKALRMEKFYYANTPWLDPAIGGS